MKRVFTVILAVIALGALIYSVVQKRIADENIRIGYEQAKLTDSLRAQLGSCAAEARRQQQLAAQAAIRAAEAQKQAVEELRKYRRK